MKHTNLSSVYTKYFQLYELDKYNMIRYIPTGEFQLFDYNTGLLSIKLRKSIKYVNNRKQDGASISVTINNIDDGDWSAETPLISDDADFDIIFYSVTRYINELTSLPDSETLILDLSTSGEIMFTSLHKL